MKNRLRIYLFVSVLLTIGLFVFPVQAKNLGESVNFYLDPTFDLNNRSQISGQLIFESSKLYFYIDESLWKLYSAQEKSDTIVNLSALSSEFENKIYPVLTANYGNEPNPGIDGDSKITLLFHQLKRGAGGYFNSGNEYSKYEAPVSNEREMVYLNSDYIASPLLKRLLAHEFTHLITFNQKDKLNNIEEDVWLNEGRAEYAITLCGYDDIYQGSNLQKRVVEFLKNPNDSLTDWQGVSSDYGVLNIFTQYFVDQYGVRILKDSLVSRYKGIESINFALSKNGYEDNFSNVFKNWTVAVLLNDCNLGARYCYKNSNLRNLKVMPTIDSLAIGKDPELSVNFFNTPWSGHWDKIIGSNGNFHLIFNGDKSGFFEVNYILCDKTNKCEITSLNLNSGQNGEVNINNSEIGFSSLSVISFLKKSNTNALQSSLRINGSATTGADGEETKKLLSQIDELQKKISAIKILLNNSKNTDCGNFSINLYFGMTGNPEVSCLQNFLKEQGVYPEGIISGNFFSKTKNAVMRFQEKYADEILLPLGLTKGTGIVGAKTREKINQLLP